MRRMWSISGNSQRLDGGAMFGNAPRALWSRWIKPDELNRIPLACRALLVEEQEGPTTRRILFEAGIGVFFEPKMRERFGVQEENHVLLDSLAAVGVSPGEIDVVVLSHLHFDHAGGLLTSYDANRPHRLVFSDADYVVGQDAWERAIAPHMRDRASFIPELPGLLEATGRLELVRGSRSETLGDGYSMHFSEGHTPGLMLAEVSGDDGPVLFGGDLIPGRPWLHAPITMGYDRFPERLIEEKVALLTDLARRQGKVFFTHDSEVAMAAVVVGDRGRFTAGQEWADVVGVVP